MRLKANATLLLLYCGKVKKKEDDIQEEKNMSSFGARQFVLGPMGALTFDRAVRDGLAAATDLQIRLLLATITAGNRSSRRTWRWDRIVFDQVAVKVERLDKSGQPGTVSTLRKVLLLPRRGLDLCGIEAEDVSEELDIFRSFKFNHLKCVRQAASLENLFAIVFPPSLVPLALTFKPGNLALIQNGQEKNRSAPWRSANGKMDPDEPFSLFWWFFFSPQCD